MKILQFAHSFFPELGGTTTRLLNLLENPKQYEHYLYVPNPEYYQVSQVDNKTYKNIKIRRCNLFKPILKGIPSLIKFEINTKKLLNCVRERDFDIVHGHNPILYAYTAMKYAKARSLPFILEIHIFNLDAPIRTSGFIFSRLLNYFQEKLLKKKMINIYFQANMIIVQTENIKNRLLKFINIDEKIVKVIPMGIDEELFNPKKWSLDGKKLRKERNWNSKIILMYNGYLIDYNGLKQLCRAVISLPPSIKKKIKLIVLGRGPLQNYIENLEKKNRDLIEFLGLVDYKRMPIYYSCSDIIITPRLKTYFQDNVPTKLLEAMAMEKIVLGSEINSIRELIIDGKNGFLVKITNESDLTQKLIYIIENIQNFEKLKKNARKSIIEEYSWKRMKKILYNLYDKLL